MIIVYFLFLSNNLIQHTAQMPQKRLRDFLSRGLRIFCPTLSYWNANKNVLTFFNQYKGLMKAMCCFFIYCRDICLVAYKKFGDFFYQIEQKIYNLQDFNHKFET